LIVEIVEDMTSSYTDLPLPKERNPKQSPTIKDSGTSYYMTKHPTDRTLENLEMTSTTTTETAILHRDPKTKKPNQTPHLKQSPTEIKGNNEQNQVLKMKLTNKSVTHQLLSNHYVKHPHHEEPHQSPAYYRTKSLTFQYYHHQQLNALALLHLRRNNLHLHPLTWQQQLQLQQQRYNHQFKPRQLEPLPLLPLQQIKEYTIDSEQPCGEQEEDPLEEDNQEAEEQDQSLLPLPKLPYRQLLPET